MSSGAASADPPSTVIAERPPSADEPDVNPVVVVEPSRGQNFKKINWLLGFASTGDAVSMLEITVAAMPQRA
jgi:hypothetical protein